MIDPFAKYVDHYHADMFAGEFRRDHVGATPGDMLIAYAQNMIADMKRHVEGIEPLPSHRPAPQREN